MTQKKSALLFFFFFFFFFRFLVFIPPSFAREGSGLPSTHLQFMQYKYEYLSLSLSLSQLQINIACSHVPYCYMYTKVIPFKVFINCIPLTTKDSMTPFLSTCRHQGCNSYISHCSPILCELQPKPQKTFLFLT